MINDELLKVYQSAIDERRIFAGRGKRMGGHQGEALRAYLGKLHAQRIQ
jgi:hypothetical protein